MKRAQAFKEITKRDNILLWVLLSFQAGFINAGGFLACGRFVSHVTGYGTQIGLKFSDGSFWIALEMMLAPVAFIAGAAFSAYLIDRPYFRGETIKIGGSLLTQSILLLLIFALGEYGFFGEFGEPLILQRDFELLFLLCFVCGLQNATFSCLTNGQVRTTHMTGTSTDLGMNLVRLPFLKLRDEEKRHQKELNWVRLYTLMSFMMGSGIAAFVFSKLGYHGFIVPALSSLLVMYQSYRIMGESSTS